MPAKDFIHDIVKNALIKDGWTITHDPYSLKFGIRDLYTDLAAERTVGAEKEGKQIAVEIKSFLGASEVYDLEVALGQFVLYRYLLKGADPDRQMFLALPDDRFRRVLGDGAGQELVREMKLSLFTVDLQTEEIRLWLP